MRQGLFPFVKTRGWDIAVGILIVLEVAFMLYFHNGILPNWINEIGFTASSLAIGAAFFLKYYGRNVHDNHTAGRAKPATLRWIAFGLLALGGMAYVLRAAPIFRAMPIDAGSDVIPTIEVAVNRLLHGETVYATIDKWGYDLPLTYLPMQWLPYMPAELLHFDYRWIAAIIFAIAAFVVVGRSSRVAPRHGLAAALLILYLGWMLLEHDTGILSMTVELMVAGYYMLLIAGISGRNPWLRGAAIAVCLLSRYSVVLWLPLWAAIEFFAVDRKDFFRSCAAILLIVVGIYVVPFLSNDWGAFYRGYQYYDRAALGEWNNLGDNGVPYQLNNGLGFARLFYQKLAGYTVPDRIRSLQKVHLVVCLGSTLIMGIGYWLLRSRIHPRIFLLASFKIYLSLFLAFIQVPYPYLMVTAAAVSIAIFVELVRWNVVPRGDLGNHRGH